MFVPTRRRRGEQVESPLSAVAMTEAQGVEVVAFYDALYNASTSEWADVRASGGGPTLTLSNTPTLSGGQYTFNGSTQYGRNASAGRLSEITAACGVVFIGTPPATAGTEESLFELSVGASPSVAGIRRAVSSGNVYNTPFSSAATAVGAGAMVVHVRRSAGVGGTITGGIAIGDGAEVTHALTLSDLSPTRLTVGAQRSDTPALYSDVSVRAIVVLKGNVTATVRAIWTAYGRTRGASA